MQNGNFSVYRGRLVRDAKLETKQVKGEAKSLLTFSIAYDSFATTDSEGSHTSFMDVQVWGKGADINANLKQGESVTVYGETVQHRWQDKEGGKHSTFRINADRVDALAKREKAEG